MSEFGEEGGESPSEGGDNQSDEVPDETSDEGLFNPNDDVPDESPDEGLFNPNDDVPDESPDEGLFNPNDDVPDESQDEGLFNPNDDVPDESPDEGLFNPNDDVPDESPDERLFNPNDDVPDESPDEELFNPNDDVPDESPDEELFNPIDDVPDESPDEELFNPNDDVPDESPDEELFNPNDDVPDESPDENHNPSSSGTITVTVPEEPELEPDNTSETNPEQEHENEPEKQAEGIVNPNNLDTVTVVEPEESEQESDQIPEQKPEHELEEKPEEFELVTPDGEPEKPSESPEIMKIRADLEEMGLAENTEPFYRYDESPEINSDHDLEQETEQNHEYKSELELEREFNKLLEQEEKKVSINDQELKIEDEIHQDGKIKEEIESQEIQEEPKESLQESFLEKPQESKEKMQDAEKDNYEVLKEQYHQETGRKAIYAKKETKGFIEWKEGKGVKEYKEYEEKQELDKESKKEIQEKVEKQKEQTTRERDNSFKELYKQETGKRPIYAGKETKGFIEWKEYLKEQEENQRGNNELLHEIEKENRVQTREIRESKEEWVKYLANSIKEAEFSEEIRDQANRFLEKYKALRELLEKLKKKEITEEEFENKVKELESIFIEKNYIARSLFMNFDWFRRYYNGMIRKAGKRVAHLYISKKTRDFLSYISGRIEQLQNIGISQENLKKFKEFLEKSFQIKEKWALLLNRLIRETPNNEISTEVKKELGAAINMFCKIRAFLFNKSILEEDKEKLIQERIEKCNPRFFELFEILKRFLGDYDNYSRKWMEQSLIIEGKTTVRRLSQKLKAIKVEAVQEILNGDNSILHKFKEILRVNLYKSTELNMNEKSKLIKIIQKKDISEEDRKVIKSLLGSLSKRELTTLLKNDFKNYFLPKPDLSSGVNKTRPLKYSFNRNDNNATRLIKTILNQIYENKRALEQYHFRQKEKNEFTFLKGKDIFYPQQEVLGSISLYNLGKFLGVSRSKARNWLIALDQNRIIKLPDLEFRKIRAAILRFFQGDGGSIVKSRQIIKYAIESYMDKCYNEMDFITKIVLLLDECAIWKKIEQSKGDPHSLLSISKRMGMNRNYLLEIKKRLKNAESNQYSKFFTLSTNILLLKYRSFKFKNRKNYEKFKTRALDIIFQEMVRQGIFSDENAELMRRQYNVLVYTLYALTKARNKRFSLLKLKPDSTGRDNKGIYTLSDLSRKIGGRKLFADYLLYETFISRETLAEIKNQLDENKGYAAIECEFALNLLNEIPRIRLGQRPSYVGRRSHPILENFFRKLWLKLGIISKHEYQFNYPNSLHRIDSTLEVSTQQKLIDLLKSSSDSSLSKFKTLFIDYTIPNLVRFNICVLDKISPEKKYLAKNRSVILVFYGIYSEKIFKTLQMKLNSLKLNYKKNIRFMDITKFIQLFTNNADELRELDEINTLIKKALDDDNEEALEELDRKADDALFDLSKYNK